MDLLGRIGQFRLLARDRDAKFTAVVNDIFTSEGVRVVKSPLRAPHTNYRMSRFPRCTMRWTCPRRR